MNSHDLIRLGVPRSAHKRAIDFIAAFLLKGGDKHRLEEEIHAIVANPALFALMFRPELLDSPRFERELRALVTGYLGVRRPSPVQQRPPRRRRHSPRRGTTSRRMRIACALRSAARAATDPNPRHSPAAWASSVVPGAFDWARRSNVSAPDEIPSDDDSNRIRKHPMEPVGSSGVESHPTRMFVLTGGWFSSAYRLNHRADGACVFLGPDNRCRIHEKHGPAAKPDEPGSSARETHLLQLRC